MSTRLYARNSALAYIQKWALARNPKYYNLRMLDIKFYLHTRKQDL